MAQIYSNMPERETAPDAHEAPEAHEDAYYNYPGINQPAMMGAIGVIVLGLLVFMTAAFLPFGFIIMVIGGFWAMIILWMGRRTPDSNHRL